MIPEKERSERDHIFKLRKLDKEKEEKYQAICRGRNGMSYLEIYKKYVTEDEFKRSTYFAAVKAGEISEEDAYVRLLCRKEWMYGEEIEQGRKSEVDAKITVWRYLDLIGEDFIEDRHRRYEIEKKYEPIRKKYWDREKEKKREIEKMKKRRKDAIPLSAVFIVGIPSVFWLMATDFAFPVMLYGSVGPSFIFWLPIAGIIDYYYKKKIEGLEKDLTKLKQEKKRMSDQEFKEKYKQ